MARGQSIDRGVRRAILDARTLIQQAEKADCNEAETRRRIERLFESLMGYDTLKHLSRERAVRGAGETEHVDFTIHVEDGDNPRPVMMVEIKRVAIDLARKHLKQVVSYAIDAGCEWALLTNAREWKLYHIAFGQPPETREVRSWNLLTDDVAALSEGFNLISLKSLKHDSLTELWQKTHVLMPRNLLEAILGEKSLNEIRRQLRRTSGVLLPPEEIVGGVRRLLNESALSALEEIRISFPQKKTRAKRPRKSKDQPEANASAATESSAHEDPA